MAYRSHVMLCGGTGCTSSGSAALIEEFEKQIKLNGLENEVKVVRTGCFGLCQVGPICVIYPEGSFYAGVKAEDVEQIVQEHLLKGRVVKSLLYTEKDETAEDVDTTRSLEDVTFYKKQKRVALKNCGMIDPENIDEYIAFDGYKALEKVLGVDLPDDIIEKVVDGVKAKIAVDGAKDVLGTLKKLF